MLRRSRAATTRHMRPGVRCLTIALPNKPAWNRIATYRLLTGNDDPTDPPATPRSREHPHPARGRRRVRTARDAVLDRQGQLGAAAPGDEGFLSGEAAVPAAARRYHLEVSRNDRVSRRHRCAPRRAAARAHQ